MEEAVEAMSLIVNDEQQRAQHTLSALISTANGFLNESLLRCMTSSEAQKNRYLGEAKYLEMSRLVYQIIERASDQVDRHHNIEDLDISVGNTRESTDRSLEAAALKDVLQALMIDGNPHAFQKVPSKKKDGNYLVRKTKFDNLFLVQFQRPTVMATVSSNSYSLVGLNKLPHGYQRELVRK